MRGNTYLIVVVLLLVSLIVGATFFYDKLKDTQDTTSLVILDDSATKTDESPPADNVQKETPKEQDSAQKETSAESDNAQDPEEDPTKDEEKEAEKTPIAMSIPDFTVYDKEGNEVKLSDFIGKPIVLNFFASWCGPCKSEMPDFEAAYKEHGDGVQFLMINLTDGYYETVESASAFIKQSGYTFPVYYDTSSSAAIAYSVVSIPTTYFIDAEGNIVAKATGALSAKSLAEGIALIG